MFKRELILEIARCLNIPYNVAAGDSSSYNYSSSKLDHILYGRSMQVERAQFERVVLDRVFAAWYAEARLIPGLLPAGLPELVPHCWYWDPVESADPVKDATADQIRLETDTVTLQEIYAEKGQDWQDAIEQRMRERARVQELARQYGLQEEVTKPRLAPQEEAA